MVTAQTGEHPQGEHPQRASWFKRHLNWTYVIAYLAMHTINLTLVLIMAYAENYELDWLLWVDIPVMLAWLGVGGWVIKQKRRSLWWLLLAGCLSPVWIGNASWPKFRIGEMVYTTTGPGRMVRSRVIGITKRGEDGAHIYRIKRDGAQGCQYLPESELSGEGSPI